MRHIQTETKCKSKNKTRWFVEAYKHVLQFFRCPTHWSCNLFRSYHEPFPTAAMSRPYLHVVTVEFRTNCHFVTEYARNMNETAGEGETNLRDFNMRPVNASTQTQYNVTDIATCRHSGISNRLQLRNRICHEHEWNGRRRWNQPSWLFYVASRLCHLSTTIFTG